MSKGKICLIVSAFLYGLAPVFAKLAYAGGVNGITLTFLRTALMLPVMLVLMKARRQSFYLNKKELINITALGVVGGTLSMIALYAAYEYISTGLATTLHFIYPLIIVVVSALIYREKVKGVKLLAVMLVTVGVFMFVDLNSRADKAGVILAVLSGVFYSFYVIYMAHSGIDRMDYVKLTFYLMVIMSIGTLLFGILSGGLDFESIKSSGWIYAAVVSVLISLGAIPLFQAGVRYEGASTAGIISAFEPITTIILGALFLGETMGIVQYIGGAVIILGVVLAEKYG
ncbi:MAG: DMT family transporter [Clostridia bacterium]|nr:DMT family transporter [Clostridia bacterium]